MKGSAERTNAAFGLLYEALGAEAQRVIGAYVTTVINHHLLDDEWLSMANQAGTVEDMAMFVLVVVEAASQA